MIRTLFLLLLFIPLVNANVTELYYDPPGNDNNKEYIELVFDTATSLDGWRIADESNGDILLLLEGTGNTAINLIIEEDYIGPGANTIDTSIVSIYTAGKAIGNGLNNNGDTFTLYDLDNTPVLTFSYTNEYGQSDGNALCFTQQDTYACTPTPGVLNSQDIEEEIIEDEEDTQEKPHKIEKTSSNEAYFQIDHIRYSGTAPCMPVHVDIGFWNDHDTQTTITATIQDINIPTTLTVKPETGQVITLPVATCATNSTTEAGEYILLVTGLGYERRDVLWLNGSTPKPIETHIKQILDTPNTILPPPEPQQKDWLDNILFSLLYLTSGLGTYYVLFKEEPWKKNTNQ